MTEKEKILREFYRNGRLIDDMIMNYAFKDNNEAVGYVVRTILGIDDLEIVSSTIQDFKSNILYHSIVLDIVGKDSQGNIYNIEMQTNPKRSGIKRARYYCSMLDCQALGKDKDYEELPKVYVIFITEGPFLNRKEPIIEIRRAIYTNELEPIDDGQHIIFIDAKKATEGKIGNLMHDLTSRTSDDINSQILKDALNYAKNRRNEDMYIEGYCMNEEELINNSMKQGLQQGIQQGMQQGKKDKAIDIAKNLLKMNLDASMIANATGLSVDEIKAL